jgi:hypothetical protein
MTGQHTPTATPIDYMKQYLHLTIGTVSNSQMPAVRPLKFLHYLLETNLHSDPNLQN